MDDSLPSILCVDDDVDILELLKEYFTEQGFVVLTATNGVEAFLQVKRWQPKAVILDLFMPRLGGIGALGRIRALNPDIVVILVSGMGKGGNRYFALDVTNPADITNEATAASKVLWEFADPNMGFTYGKPMIAKTNAFGGTWLVIVASGYNNPDGHGYLYFIRASDGHLMKTMTTSGDSGCVPPLTVAFTAMV